MKAVEDADKRQTLRCVSGVLVGVSVGISDAAAQARAKLPLIGILDPGPAHSTNPWLPAFKQALAGLGWAEGRTVGFETRYADHRPDQMAGLAREVIGLKPDLIFTYGSIAMVRTVAEATATVPIVVGVTGEFVATGLARSLARPGGNVTGMTLMIAEENAKRLEVMRDALPSTRRVGALNEFATTTAWDEAVAATARTLGLQLQIVRVAAPSEISGAIATLKKQGADALFMMDGPMLAQAAPEVTALALKLRLPSIAQSPGFADAGGLLQFGADIVELIRSSARHVDRILRGARPQDLPIEQPTKFDLVVNLNTANALGLKIPPGVLARADRVVE
jgi:putative ABC transport system substrate-binding protein